MLAVAQPHHESVFRLRGHFEHIGNRIALDDERVVPRRGERARQSREHTDAGVPDLRGLAVHDVRRTYDLPAVDLADALEPQTHPQHRHAPLAEVPDRLVRTTGVAGPARTG